MTTGPEPSAAQRLVGDIAPKLAELTDEVLFGDVWAHPELSRRDRSLITVAALSRGCCQPSHTLRCREADAAEPANPTAIHIAGGHTAGRSLIGPMESTSGARRHP